MIKREIFECVNTHSRIEAYLKGYQITDAETQGHIHLEKFYRGEYTG
jgi:hypothetical protein